MEILIALLFKLAPYIVVVLGALGLYFGVKHKGAREEKERQIARDATAKRQTEAKLGRAIAKDEAIDASVEEKVKKLEAEKSRKADSDGKFRF